MECVLIFGDSGVEAVVVLTSVGTFVEPANVWDLGSGVVVGGVLVVVVVGSVVGLVVVVIGSDVVVVSVVLVAAVVLVAVVLAASLDGGFLTCLAGIFFLLEEPTSLTSCCCSLFFCTKAFALTSKVSALFCFSSAAFSAFSLAEVSTSFALLVLAVSVSAEV